MTQRNRSHDWHGKVQEEKQIGFQEGPESYHLFQVQGVMALLQKLPKKEDEDPRRLYNHKKTSKLVRCNMFPL